MQEIIKEFIKNAELTTATTELVKNSEVSSALKKQIQNEKQVLSALGKKCDFESEKLITNPSNEDLKSIKTCITHSLYGIASTGSILIDNDHGFTSYSTMLTSKHIVLLAANNIYAKPRDIFKNDELLNMSSISIITGPSATADMGSLVRGVHGPEHLHIIIIVEDEK